MTQNWRACDKGLNFAAKGSKEQYPPTPPPERKVMGYGFRKLPTDVEFARRSARYLAALGYRPIQIGTTLVTELNVAPAIAEDIVAELNNDLALAS